MTPSRLLNVACVLGAASLAHGQAFTEHPAADEVMYHIMPIAWRDSNNDAQRFGDFGGLTASLDYLQNLGVTGVWLNPIFPSPAYHGYQHGPGDQVNPWFGTEAQFLSFVQAAHARGIKVYLDFVVYGVSHNSTYFQSAYNNRNSQYDSWLAFTNTANTSYQGYTFSTWNGSNVGIIHWDLRSANARNTVIAWGDKWLDPNNDGDTSDGIDGYRYDHVWIQYGSGPDGWGYNLDDFWTPYFGALRATKPQSFHFGEQADWGVYGEQFLSQFDAMFTKPFEFAARDALANANAAPLYSSMSATVNAAVAAGRGTFVCTIGNHDVNRLASAIGADTAGTISKLKAAAAVLMLQPFVPNLYYGDEIGMKGVKGNFGSDADDIPMREPFKWNAVAGAPMSNYWTLNSSAYNARYARDNDGRSVQEQQGVAGSVLETYRGLIALRKNNIALRRGGYTGVASSDPRVWAFLRRHAPAGGPEQTLLCVINLSGSQFSTALNLGTFTVAGGSSAVTDIALGQTLANITNANKGAYQVSLGAYGHRVLAMNVAPPTPQVNRIDGQNITTDAAPAFVSALQNTPTALGDNIGELNQLLVKADADGLLVGITGNLPTDATALALFLDTTPGGQTTVNTSAHPAPPGGLAELTGLAFDPGFAPDRLYFINAPGATYYVDQVNLTAGGSTKVYRGNGGVNSGSGALTGGTASGLQVAINNTNTGGVTSSSAAGAGTATRGVELLIPYADLGLSAPFCGTFGAAAFLVRSSGEVTQQWLPGLSTATSPGTAPSLALFAGTQHVFGTRPASACLPCTADFDGDGDVGTDSDIEAFFACLGGACCPTCGSADFDNDGDTGTDADIEAFFRVLGGGAC